MTDLAHIVDTDRLELRHSIHDGARLVQCWLDGELVCGVLEGYGWWPDPTDEAFDLLVRAGVVSRTHRDDVRPTLALSDFLNRGLDAAAPAPYADDDNEGRGWTMQLTFTDGEALSRHHDSLGAARGEGLHLSCIAGAQEVLVYRAGMSNGVICRWSRADNRWRDEDERIRVYERYLDALALRYPGRVR